jgi:tol-pal system protein YbgF
MKLLAFKRFAIVLVALLASSTAFAQKQSLSDRIAALEQKSAAQSQGSGQANVELLNRLTQLQSEMKALREQIEALQNENAQLKQRNRDQYIDLDTRLNKLEANPAAAATVPRTTTTPPRTGAGATTVPPTTRPPSTTTTRTVTPIAGTRPPSTSATVPSDAANEQSAYGMAFDALKRKDYVESARLFKTFTETYPQGSLAPNAWYWLGESYYVTQNYEIAMQSFEALLSQFPDSSKVPDGMLKLGYCQTQLGLKDRAKNTFNEVLRLYPMTDAARFAQSQLRSMNLGP